MFVSVWIHFSAYFFIILVCVFLTSVSVDDWVAVIHKNSKRKWERIDLLGGKAISFQGQTWEWVSTSGFELPWRMKMDWSKNDGARYTLLQKLWWGANLIIYAKVFPEPWCHVNTGFTLPRKEQICLPMGFQIRETTWAYEQSCPQFTYYPGTGRHSEDN